MLSLNSNEIVTATSYEREWGTDDVMTHMCDGSGWALSIFVDDTSCILLKDLKPNQTPYLVKADIQWDCRKLWF